MGYKSKYSGKEVEERLENVYFYTIPVSLMEKIYNLENLSIEEGENLYRNALRALHIVFPENTMTPSNLNGFYFLGYIEASDKVYVFDLNTIIYDVEDGAVSMRGYTYRFTRQGEQFTIEEL